jgi:uncharacterized phage-associated protein
MDTYDSVLVAKYMMAIANNEGIVLNVTKVQKLLFITYSYFLTKGRRIVDEQPKAWPFGPVFPKTRNKINYGIIIPLNAPEFEIFKPDVDLTDFLNYLIKNVGRRSASYLTEWSHQDGSPWHKTTLTKGFQWNDPIPDDFIKEYFSKSFNATTAA